MVNINFLVISYFIGLFVDWIFQWNWQAINKSKWDKNDNKLISFLAVTSHSFVYAVITSFIVLYLIGDFAHIILVLMVLFVSHTIIDTRILVKLIMKFKGMSNDQINDYQNYGFMHIGIDHRLHELVLLILSLII